MTTYTAPHNLPIIEPALDKIKSTDVVSALGDRINALAVATGNAISIEGGRAESAAKSAAATDATTKANTAEDNAKAYADRVVDTSHLALDTDGTPYFSPGSMTLRVLMDTDGVPFFFEA